MKHLLLTLAISAISSFAHAGGDEITVYKDPNCGCCSAWMQHMEEAGFKMTAINSSEMHEVKARLGVPAQMGSCHTAVVAKTGQVIEGHVPAAAVEQLIVTPNVKGIAVPGMPMNSPGMGAMDGNLVTVDFEGIPFSKN